MEPHPPTGPAEPGQKPRARRPRLLILLMLALALLSLLGWLRMAQAIAQWGFLNSLLDWPLPLYLAVGGVVWGLLALPALWGLWRRKRWAIGATWVAVILYPLLYWLDWLFAVRSQASRSNWPFALVMTLFWLAFSAFVLTRKTTHASLGR